MIKDPPLLTVRRHVARPDAAALEALVGVPTGHVVDCMDGAGALAYRIKPLDTERAAFVGVAVTCWAGPADNLAVFGALTLVEPGDVIVAATDAYTGTCITGDLLVGMARNCGAAAFVTDGLLRDTDGIRKVGIPVFGAGVTPNSPARNGPGTVGLPITLGNVAVASGDVVLGDRDGVVVIARANLAQVLSRLGEVAAAEAELEAKVDAGLKIPEFFRAVVAGRVQEVD